MPSWSAVQAAAPGLMATVRGHLDAHVHKTLATVRRDGAPRISGTETRWRDGELYLGGMWRSRKALDLLRDPRFALHSGSDDPPPAGPWTGDAKLAGIAVAVTDDALVRSVNGDVTSGPTHLFRLDIREVSTVALSPAGDRIVVRWWTPEGGEQELERA